MRLLSTLVLLLSTAALAWDPGARLIVTTRAGAKVSGKLVVETERGLLIAGEGKSTLIAFDDIAGVEELPPEAPRRARVVDPTAPEAPSVPEAPRRVRAGQVPPALPEAPSVPEAPRRPRVAQVPPALPTPSAAEAPAIPDPAQEVVRPERREPPEDSPLEGAHFVLSARGGLGVASATLSEARSDSLRCSVLCHSRSTQFAGELEVGAGVAVALSEQVWLRLVGSGHLVLGLAGVSWAGLWATAEFNFALTAHYALAIGLRGGFDFPRSGDRGLSPGVGVIFTPFSWRTGHHRFALPLRFSYSGTLDGGTAQLPTGVYPTNVSTQLSAALGLQYDVIF